MNDIREPVQTLAIQKWIQETQSGLAISQSRSVDLRDKGRDYRRRGTGTVGQLACEEE